MGNVRTNVTYAYDIASPSSVRVLPGQLKIARVFHGCLMLDQEGKLIVAAGSIASGRTQTVEILDLNTETWSDGSVLPGTPNYNYQFIQSNNVWIGFGYYSAGPPDVVQYYASDDEWEQVPIPEFAPNLASNKPYLAVDVVNFAVC